MLRAETIVEILCRRIDESGDSPALAVKREGQFRWYTWGELAAEVARTVAVLVELGIRPGDRVAQLSENRFEWIIADFAIQMAGAIHVPIHAPLTGQQASWQVRHSGAKVLLVSGPVQAAKLTALTSELPANLVSVSFDPCPEQLAGRHVELLGELQARADFSKGIDAACQARKHATADDLITILYTSGTTGEPKGVMLTQGNLASNAIATIDAFGDKPEQLRLNFLPLSHIFARTCDLYCWVAQGSRLALAESRESVIADCQAMHPTYINGVPYFYDKVYRGLCEHKVQHVPGALKAALGGAMETCGAGGAALPGHLYDYFHSQGVALLEGYGLSESSPVITISTNEQHRRGSCGKALPGIEVCIAGDGEILTRGPHVMRGYYENPAATAEVMIDGWLHTGDLGRLDEDGFLYITGRKKEILVTSGGKNIAPVYLESLITQDPLFLQAMVLGDSRSYLAALLVPNLSLLCEEMNRSGAKFSDNDSLLTHPAALAVCRERIDRQLAVVSTFEQVRKFTLLTRAFSLEAGELTAKLSLRRKQIEANFAAEISAMYGSVGC